MKYELKTWGVVT